MKRQDMRGFLSRHLDGDLGPGEEAALQAALQEDPELRRELEDHLAVREALGAVRSPPPPVGLDQRIADRVLASAPARRHLIPGTWRAAAAVLLLALLGLGGHLAFQDDVSADPQVDRISQDRLRRAWIEDYGVSPGVADRIIQLTEHYRKLRSGAGAAQRRRLDDLESRDVLRLLTPRQRALYRQRNSLTAREMERLLRLDG